MRTLVHLTHLSFGKLAPDLLPPLAAKIEGLQPSVITVAGDLSTNAIVEELRAARTFLETLSAPRVVVPGRNDVVPQLALLERLKGPYERFRREVEPKAAPFYSDNEITVLGMTPGKRGPTPEQITLMQQTFATATPGAFRILVSRSPFFPSATTTKGASLATAQEQLVGSRIDLFLAGTVGRRRAPSSGPTWYLEPDASNLPAEIFHVLRIAGSEILVERYAWEDSVGDYRLARATRFRRGDTRWEAA